MAIGAQNLVGGRWITAAQFHEDRAFEHNHYILNGEVFTDMGNAHRAHEIVKSRLHEALIFSLRQNNVRGRVFSETAYELDTYSVLIPDISVQIPERESGKGFFMASPEIAVEIMSPSNSPREIDLKARAYWAHGAKAVWVLDPERRQTFAIDAVGQWIPVEESFEAIGLSVQISSVWP